MNFLRVLDAPYAKWTALILLALCCIVLFIGTRQHVADQTNIEDLLIPQADLATQIVREKILWADGQAQRAILEKTFQQIKIINPNIDLYLVDLNGQILASSIPSELLKRTHIDLKPVWAKLAGNTAPASLEDDARDKLQSKVFSVAPIPSLQGVESYLYITLGDRTFSGLVSKTQAYDRWNIGILAFISALILLFFCGWALIVGPTKRMRRLLQALMQFKHDGFTNISLLLPQRSLQHQGEIEQLALSVEEMASSITKQFHALQQTDALRRELIANISHDLRNPLTSLQGYLETLQIKGATLTNEQRENYLAIAIKHCYRINKLMHEFFDLAKLECNEARPTPGMFSLSELAQHILNKFELTAKARGVFLSIIGNTTPHSVMADMGMVERVLVNLIDNALRFTPSGGNVAVLLKEANGKVAVSVSDTGCGIASKDIPHIFNQYHRLSNPAHYSPDSTGLGLAIVKRILSMHSSEIHVESEVGVGTTFTFYLALAKDRTVFIG